MQKGQPGVRKPSARPTPAIISVFRPFRYFVKVGGIAEKWMPLPRFTKLQCQSGTGPFDGGLVDIADGDPGAEALQTSGSSQADSAGPTHDGS